MVETFFDVHAHTCYSNIRLIDCINRPKDLIDRAIEIGLEGMSITDHEALCAHMIVNKYAKELKEKYPNFRIALGNEIYLTETRDKNQKYYHFILLAKDRLGYKGLCELSSTAWYNVYVDRRLERVPTLKSELKEIMKKYKGHIIATTACMGGELSTNLYGLALARKAEDKEKELEYYNNAINFINFCIDVFGKEDFYIECAPSVKPDQVLVNKQLLNVAHGCDLKMVVGTDAHFMKKEDRYVHKAYLNSKQEEREVDDFYEYAYLQSPEEVREHLRESMSDRDIDWLFENSLEIKNKIEFYSLEKHQHIPEVKVKDYPKKEYKNEKCPTLSSLFISDNIQERYWVNQCFEALISKGIGLKEEYVERLEEEARIKRVIGEKLQTCMFAYPNTLQHYIDLFWNCGSTVGAGRGSACSGLNHYLLGVTQLDPIEWGLPFWRYLNDERVELGDIDIDLCPSKLPKIFEAIRKERGELGIVQVCTFGTEATKSAVLTACRGYRSEDYPDGIDVDDAQYISSLVPADRGFLWDLHDMIEGNPDKGRQPQKQFINAVNAYPGLLDIMKGIEGLVSRRAIHASGVIFFDENIYDEAAIMRARNGNITTQWDLHDQEAAGSVKYDFLLTAVQDIIVKTIELLQEDNVIDPSLSLREAYDKYLHPSILPRDDEKMWKALEKGSVIGCFQFEGQVGAQAAKKIKPKTPLEMADANGLMRLMASEQGAEMPLDKYVRYKNNISLWYKEMRDFGLSTEEQEYLEPYFKQSYGVPPSQEQLMMMLMDKHLCGFSLAEANAARKIVGKKQMSKIPKLRETVLERAANPKLGEYIWRFGAGPQMGYSFSIIHALAYSFIGMQTLYLGTHFNPVYWNTAYLIVNSGSLETESLTDDDKQEGTNYTKIAKAIGQIRAAGIKVSLADINRSKFSFEPDPENNQILFGMKGMLNVGDDIIEEIIKNRPYVSPRDFINKINPKRNVMISLIKGGAFDNLIDRKECMAWYIWETCDKKKKLNLQNLLGLMKYKLLPEENENQVMARRVYEFNRYLKAITVPTNKLKPYYVLDERALGFLVNIQKEELICQNGNIYCILKEDWDKIYQKWMDIFRQWLTDNQEEILDKYNKIIFLEDWNKYAKGTLSAWEMEALCFYYHEHELKNIDNYRYGFVNFNDLPVEPEIERSFYKGTKKINLFKLYKICGTCIAKNKLKSSVTLLTTSGIVEVKFRKEYFSLFDRQISAKGEDGKKHIIEKSWFNRGSMIIVRGMRSEDTFIAKKYNSTEGHTLYKIDEVIGDEIKIRATRAQGDLEDDE